MITHTYTEKQQTMKAKSHLILLLLLLLLHLFLSSSFFGKLMQHFKTFSFFSQTHTHTRLVEDTRLTRRESRVMKDQLKLNAMKTQEGRESRNVNSFFTIFSVGCHSPIKYKPHIHTNIKLNILEITN